MNKSFQATVSTRKAKDPNGPPGESEILRLNPRRLERIRQATGWSAVFPGSLNLQVADDRVHGFWQCLPAMVECGRDVQYPEGWAHIPLMRVGYIYFEGAICNGSKQASVLFRKAANPLPALIEAFADRSLRESLGLIDGLNVTCEVEIYDPRSRGDIK